MSPMLVGLSYRIVIRYLFHLIIDNAHTDCQFDQRPTYRAFKKTLLQQSE